MMREMWTNDEEKIISFLPILDWRYELFASEEDVLEWLDFFVSHGFRFQ